MVHKRLFSCTVFNTLSHEVIRYLVASVSSKSHLLTGWKSETANQKLLLNGFGTLWTKQSTPCERLCKSVPQNGVFSCVPFCLRSLAKSGCRLDNFMKNQENSRREIQYAPNCLENLKCIKMDLKCPTIVLNYLHILDYIFMVDLKSKNLHMSTHKGQNS